MEIKKIWYLVCCIVCTFLLVVGIYLKENPKQVKRIEKEWKSPVKDENQGEVCKKRYDLPVNKADKKESEEDCLKAIQLIYNLYQNADKGEALNTVLSQNTVIEMAGVLEQLDAPIYVGRNWIDMIHYKQMDEFLHSSQRRKESKVIMYELQDEGGIRRVQLEFDGTEMYQLSTIVTWNDEQEPIIIGTTYTRIKEWKYTEKGWFCFEVSVPEPPVVSEVINGNTMIRVKPLKKEYREMAAKYIGPIGYQGNNLLCSEWDVSHLENLDYNGIFEYFYKIKYQKRIDAKQYQNGIPKQEFEDLLMEYLPVSESQLEQYAMYDVDSRMYGWENLGCGNYAPNLFGTSESEITNLRENKDGTLTICVDALCEGTGNDRVFSHEVTVKISENGKIRYLKNHILDNGLEHIPQYQYRLGRSQS